MDRRMQRLPSLEDPAGAKSLPALAGGLFVTAAALALLPSIESTAPYFNQRAIWPMSAAAFTAGLLLVGMIPYRKGGTVVAYPRAGGLALTRPAVLNWCSVAIGLVLLAELNYVLFPDPSAPSRLRWGAATLAAIGVWFLSDGVAGIIRRPAILLNETTIGLIGTSEHFTASWPELLAVKLGSGNNPRLVLMTARGSCLVPYRCLGGDLSAVRLVVDYYREHPDQRQLLADGPAAVAHVAQQLRQQRSA